MINQFMVYLSASVPTDKTLRANMAEEPSEPYTAQGRDKHELEREEERYKD